MINISALLIFVALSNFVLALWAVRQRSREGVLANVALMLAFVVIAMVAHPHYAAMTAQKRADIDRLQIEIEADRLRQLNAALGSPELTVRYIEALK